MNGEDAARHVEDWCKEARHAEGSGPKPKPVVCVYCGTVANRLRSIQSKETPPLIITTVHFVIHPERTMPVVKLDEVEAHALAREVRGMVVSWPVAGDYREEAEQ